jgi:predicted nucleotidyltransferase
MGMTGSLDISTTHRKEISALLSRYLPGVEVWAFGSRVKWSSRLNSDLDIVAFSGLDQKSEIVQLREALMESSLPFRVDLHVWQELPESFQENIKSGYVVLQEALPGALPRKEQQRAIADALGALANKIRLNLQKNETLEAIARAIYKSWFVDFDPVRAKAEGRNTGLPPHIAELFPDSFQESELGLIPKGWTVKNIDDMTRCVGGATPVFTEKPYSL